MPPRRHRPRAALAALLLIGLAPARAAAGDAAPLPAEEAPASLAARLGWTAGGFASAFLLHEGCHLAANLALGNRPTLRRVSFLGAIPFFSVSPDATCTDGRCVRRDGTPFGPGERGLAAIVSAGLLCQEAADEAILTARPRLREEQAPFLGGVLLFGTSVAAGYGLAALTGAEPPEGDLRTLATTSRVPRRVVAATVLATAALDAARYWYPDARWLPWASRGTKVATVGITVVF